MQYTIKFKKQVTVYVNTMTGKRKKTYYNNNQAQELWNK